MRPVRFLASAVALIAVGFPLSHASTPRTLTFEQRVIAQRTLDRLAHGHLIGAGRSFEEAVPMARTVDRVRGTLARSAALESWWSTPITQAVLQRELERIARDTRMPERLLEIYAALGNDPFLVRETFVRAELVERLVRDFMASDERIPAPRPAFETWWNRTPRSDPAMEAPSGMEDAASTLPLPAASTAAIEAPHWDNGSLDDVATVRTSHSVVWTGNEMIVWGGTEFGQHQALDTGARYDPATNTWRPMSTTGAPSPRTYHTAVWTGSEMIIWGGGYPYLATGGRYDPATDSWTPVPALFTPTPRAGHTAVWTGTRMIIWGGYDALGAVGTGGIYDPALNAWAPVAMAGSPGPALLHTAIWTGSEMIVWGGSGSSGPLGTGGRYRPSTDTWTSLTPAGAPVPRSAHSAVWTGSRMIVWGGLTLAGETATGALYDPALDSWAPMVSGGAPPARSGHTAVWTGSRMIVWGGSTGAGPTRTGGRYDPAADAWFATSATNAPAARVEHTAVWTGLSMVVHGGTTGAATNTGGRYDPSTDSWTPTSTTPAGTGPSVWTGSEMIVLSRPGSSGRYNPLTDTWAPVSTVNHPSSTGTAVWSGTEAITWSGGAGGRYNPASDSWLVLPTTGAPLAGRGLHSAVWTGQEMIVFGGDTGAGGFEISPTDAGGRYSPATNTWLPTPLTGAPERRAAHSAVWTGSAMIVWGGIGTFGAVDPDGARYDPATNTWTPISTAGDPSGRYLHTALWTGDEMLVWGGESDNGPEGDGARYDPAADTWSPVTPWNAPAARTGHVSVWTGTDMIVWGGDDSATWSNGGRYDPASDQWSGVPTQGAPHLSDGVAVWTGDSLIVWNGRQGGGRLVPTAANQPPHASIAGVGVVECGGFGGQTVRLDASESFDPDGTIASYEWFQTFGGYADPILLGTGPTIFLYVSVRDIDGFRQITLRVTDALGATDEQTTSVGEVDTTPPQVTCPSAVVAECAGPETTHVNLPSVNAYDACSGYDISFSRYEEPSNVPFASNNFVYGTTLVRYTIHPDFGPSAMCEFTVTVQDTTPPALSVSTDPETLWPVNHRMVDVVATIGVTDTCGGAGYVLTGVTSNEPDDVPGGSDGNTVDDIMGADIGTADREFLLRSERDGSGSGRIYTVTYEAVDSAGLRSTASAFVRVPLPRERVRPGPPVEP